MDEADHGSLGGRKGWQGMNDASMRDAWVERRAQVVGTPERHELAALWGGRLPAYKREDLALLLRYIADAIESKDVEANFVRFSRGGVGTGVLSPSDPGNDDLRSAGRAQEWTVSGRQHLSLGFTNIAERAACADALERYDSLEKFPATDGWPREPWIKYRALQDAIAEVVPLSIRDDIDIRVAAFEHRRRMEGEGEA